MSRVQVDELWYKGLSIVTLREIVEELEYKFDEVTQDLENESFELEKTQEVAYELEQTVSELESQISELEYDVEQLEIENESIRDEIKEQ